jgi:carboxyl-terminal processing protease
VKRSLDPGWPLAFTLALAALLLHQSTLRRVSEKGDELTTIANVRDLILKDWVENPTAERRERMRYGAVEGMAAQLDPYSEFIPPEKKDRWDEDTNGEFGGLGVLISIESGSVVIVAPYEGTPAWDAGVLPGDRIVEIDGTHHEFQTQEDATRRLRGKVGTSVELLVENPRRSAPIRLRITRAVIRMQSVKGARVLAAGGERLGYLRITNFQEPTVDEFDRAVASLTSQGISGLVLDLRGNPGGFLSKATDLASRFLDPGQTVVITRGRGDANETKTLAEVARGAPVIRIPTAILIDGGSASASEVLAGALRDNGRATLVGSRSFGKGSVQSLFPIDEGRAKLKLTTHHYCTPSGRRIHRLEGMTEKDEWGLLPDIAVPLEARQRQELLKQEYDLDLDELRAKRDPEAAPVDRSPLLRDPQLAAALDHVVRVIRHEAKLAEPEPRLAPVPQDVATVNTLGAPKTEPRPGGGG